ncbi:4Fe-4S dicluster domain-containing protein [Desulfitobacterium sp. PCE1]|uniref:4Fe-4S dicluster domain-containing protein n=1 Tax=Desulfitobacterium sp. PCE1 TaxID=146907 RepID=UPI00036D434A|nr:4Fe-4S dicluster domain-containing protein [Desulfitobacterium sp. PCE1]
MDYSRDVQVACQKILDNCTDCGACVSECKLLQEINEDLTALAARKPSVEEAYSCTLCGLCEGVCPSSLSPRYMFATTRKKAVSDEEVPIEEFKYMFPDRKRNVMKMYREVNGIDYKDLKVDLSLYAAPESCLP